MGGSAVEVVAFDVNDTMFSLGRLGPAFAQVGVDPSRPSFRCGSPGLLRDGFCLTAAGGVAR